MEYTLIVEDTVTITKQGQISLPAKMRKKLGWVNSGKVRVSLKDNGLLVQKEPSVMEIGGIFAKYAIKNKSLTEVMELEDKAITKMWSSRRK